MRIRAYQETDRPALISLLQLNIPKYFAPSEEQDFIVYLNEHLEGYYVVEEEGRLIGSGGINYNSDGTQARISWDFLHPDFQRRGIGKKLTLHRIQEIKKNPEILSISVRTSQLAYTFYQKLGFKLQKVVKDFWSKGFDLYEMELDL